MAICITLMFARLGGAAGANLVALFLENHCEIAFYLPGALLIGKNNNGLLIFNC